MSTKISVKIMPTLGIIDAVQHHFAANSRIAIGWAAGRGVDRVVRTAVRLARLGYEVTPYLSAHALRSRTQLSTILRDLTSVGIREVVAVTGNNTFSEGPYESDVTLMEDIAQLSGGAISSGIEDCPGPYATSSKLMRGLLEKQHHASFIIAQLQKSPLGIRAYSEALLQADLTLPLWMEVTSSISLNLPSQRRADSSFPHDFSSTVSRFSKAMASRKSCLSELEISELCAMTPTLAGIQFHTHNRLDQVPLALSTEGMRAFRELRWTVNNGE